MLLSCGKGKEGQLGHGDSKDAIIPAILDMSLLQPEEGPGANLKTRRKILQISCGRFHSACVTDDGVLFTWGSGEHGRLGHGDEKTWLKPSPCSRLSDQRVITVSCGAEHTAVLCQSRTAAYTPMRLYTWGSGRYGRLGLGNDASSSVPMLVNSLNHLDLSAVACGTNHTVVLTSKGEMYSAGSSDYGQLGHGDRKVRHVFAEVAGLQGKNLIKVSCGAHHTATVTDAGRLYTFGRDNNGQLGLGSKEDFQATPKENRSLAKKNEVVLQVSCGGIHTVVITQKGKVYSFGCGAAGRLGHGDEKDQNVPVSIKALKNSTKVSLVACGTDHTSIVTEDGKIQTFGSGAWGQLGHFDESLKALSPTLVKKVGELNVELVACGGWHTMFTISVRDNEHYKRTLDVYKKTAMANKPPVEDTLLQQVGGKSSWNKVKLNIDSGAIMEAKLEYPSHVIPKEVQILAMRIKETALKQEGVFRLSPNTQVYNTVKLEFYKDPLRVVWEKYDDPENALAPALLKDYLRGMKSAILGDQFEVENLGLTDFLEKIRGLDLQKRCMLKYVMELFEAILKHTEENRMTPKALSSVFIMGRGFFEDVPLSNLSNIQIIQRRRADIMEGLMGSFRALESMGAFPEDMRLERKKSLKTSTTFVPAAAAAEASGDIIPPPSGPPPAASDFIPPPADDFIPPPPDEPPPDEGDECLHPLTKHVLQNYDNPIVRPRGVSQMSRLTCGSYARRKSDPNVVYSLPPPPTSAPPELDEIAEEELQGTERKSRAATTATEKTIRSAMKGSRKKSQQQTAAKPVTRHIRQKREPVNDAERRVKLCIEGHVHGSSRENAVWMYLDDEDEVQGPFTTNMMEQWFGANYFKPMLKLRTTFNDEDDWAVISKIYPKGQNPFTEEALDVIAEEMKAPSEYDSWDEPITDDDVAPAEEPIQFFQDHGCSSSWRHTTSGPLNPSLMLVDASTGRPVSLPQGVALATQSHQSLHSHHRLSHSAESNFTSISRRAPVGNMSVAGVPTTVEEVVAQTPRTQCHTEPLLVANDGTVQVNICIEATKQVIGFVEITQETTLDAVRELMDEEFDYVPEEFQFMWTGVPVGRKQEERRTALDCVDTALGVLYLRTKVATPAGSEAPRPVSAPAAPQPPAEKPRRSVIVPAPPKPPPAAPPMSQALLKNRDHLVDTPSTPSSPINSSDLLNAIKGLKKAKVGDRPKAATASTHAVDILNSSLEKMMETRRRAFSNESNRTATTSYTYTPDEE